MPKQNAVAIRPGSRLRAWEKDWEVIDNDTLNRTLTLEQLEGEGAGYQKRVRYMPGQEITLRSIPFNRSKIYER